MTDSMSDFVCGVHCTEFKKCRYIFADIIFSAVTHVAQVKIKDSVKEIKILSLICQTTL